MNMLSGQVKNVSENGCKVRVQVYDGASYEGFEAPQNFTTRINKNCSPFKSHKK